MKTVAILCICLLIGVNAAAQDSKWTMGTSFSFVSWDNGQIGAADNHVQASFSIEAGYDLAKWCKLGLRHLIIRDRLPYTEPLFLNLSGAFVQVGHLPSYAKWQAYAETGIYYKNTILVDRFIRDSNLDNSDNKYGFSWGVGTRYFVWELVHIGLGLNHYIPFARLSDIDVGVLVTPKLDLIYRF